jgi:hypothetical protein
MGVERAWKPGYRVIERVRIWPPSPAKAGEKTAEAVGVWAGCETSWIAVSLPMLDRRGNVDSYRPSAMFESMFTREYQTSAYDKQTEREISYFRAQEA